MQTNVDGGDASKVEGYSPVNTKDQELKPGAEDANSSAAPEKETNTTAVLSTTQLVLRRGSTVLVLLLILITGVAFHVAFPAPEPSGRRNSTLLWVNVSTPTALTPLDLVTLAL